MTFFLNVFLDHLPPIHHHIKYRRIRYHHIHMTAVEYDLQQIHLLVLLLLVKQATLLG